MIDLGSYAPSAPVELLAWTVFIWEIVFGCVRLALLPGPDAYNPRGEDRLFDAREDRRRIRLCAHAFLRATIVGAALVLFAGAAP